MNGDISSVPMPELFELNRDNAELRDAAIATDRWSVPPCRSLDPLMHDPLSRISQMSCMRTIELRKVNHNMQEQDGSGECFVVN